jgi:hypothetical protein
MWHKTWEFLKSIRLAIVLLLIITGVSILGVLVPQGGEGFQYVQKYGNAGAKIILATGFDHVFSTLWFYALLGLLAPGAPCDSISTPRRKRYGTWPAQWNSPCPRARRRQKPF